MHKIFYAAMCIEASVDGYFWSRFNNTELSTVATVIAPYGGIWQVGLKKLITTFGFVMVGKISLNTILFVMVIF